ATATKSTSKPVRPEGDRSDCGTLSSMAARSEGVADGNEAAQQQNDERRGDEGQAFFDEVADGCAKPVEQASHEIEAHGAGDDDSEDEWAKAHLEHASGDGQHLVGKGCPALGDQNPGAPSIEQRLHLSVLFAIAVEVQDRLADRRKEIVTDR